MRSLGDVEVHLDGLTVVIGANGSGKSTLIEAFEILRRMTSGVFIDEIYNIHGGPSQLCRLETDRIVFMVVVGGEGGPDLEYRLVLERRDLTIYVADERIRQTDNGDLIYDLALERAVAHRTKRADRGIPILSERGPEEDPRIDRLRRVFGAIEVHVPFDTSASWVGRAYRRPSLLRSTQILLPASRLDTLGTNLVSAYSALKNDFDRSHWDDTLEYVRLGLGDSVESVDIAVDPGGNGGALKLKYRDYDAHLPASTLSDGTLAFLAIVAVFRLNRERSLLAWDEPDLHLHPALTARVVEMLESCGDETSVIVATHSDRLLDALSEPARSVRVMETGANLSTHVRRLDAKALGRWMDEYVGVGSIRAEGHLRSIVGQNEAGSEDERASEANSPV